MTEIESKVGNRACQISVEHTLWTDELWQAGCSLSSALPLGLWNHALPTPHVCRQCSPHTHHEIYNTEREIGERQKYKEKEAS